MDEITVEALLAVNRRFYSQFGAAFAATRRRIQDGVSRVLEQLPDEGRWLDLGCGSGALAGEWVRRGRKSAYLGLDFSAELLDEARRTNAQAGTVEFGLADLGDAAWSAGLMSGGFRGVMIFAALHHLPSRELRLRVLRQARDLLQPEGWLIHSEWQFQNSAKLMARRQPWQAAGLTDEAVDAGDALLDWRFALPGQTETSGLRYVHLFTLDELAEMAQAAGFRVAETFESDGAGGRLSVYQVWRAE